MSGRGDGGVGEGGPRSTTTPVTLLSGFPPEFLEMEASETVAELGLAPGAHGS